MPYELLSTYLNLPMFLLVASRLGGCLMFQPIFSSFAIPLNLRVILVIGLSAVIMPLAHFDGASPDSLGALALGMGSELAVGFLMGLAVAAVLSGIEMGGMLIAQESGLAFGQIVDPNSGVDQTILNSFYLELSTVVFLIVGGHRAIVSACLDTFQTVPLLGIVDLHRGTDLLVESLTAGGKLALQIAAPTVLTLFLVNVALGLISRTMPQLNIATVGFSLKSLVAFLIMAVSLPTAMTAFTNSLETVVGWLKEFTA